MSEIRCSSCAPGDEAVRITLFSDRHDLTQEKLRLVDPGGEQVWTGYAAPVPSAGLGRAFSSIVTLRVGPLKTAGIYRLEYEDGAPAGNITISLPAVFTTVSQKIFSFLQSQRCGTAGPLHEVCHRADGSDVGADLTGGWHDAGDYLKFVMTAGFTTLELLCALRYAHDVPGDVRRAFSEEAAIGLEWLLKMSGDAGGRFFFQVGHADDHFHWRRPEEDRDQVAGLRSAYEGWGKNLNGIVLAACSLGAQLLETDAPDLGRRAGERARHLWAQRDSFPDICNTRPEEFYTRSEWRDAMVVGAAWYYDLTQDSAAAEYVENMLIHVENPEISWGNVWFLGAVAAWDAGLCRDRAAEIMHREVTACAARSAREPFGRSSRPVWGVTAKIGADAQMVLLYEILTGDGQYRTVAEDQIAYMLGHNPWGVSFVVGVGERFPRYAHSQLNDIAGLNEGALVGGPAERADWERFLSLPAGFDDPYAPFQGEEVYFDILKDYYSNEVALDYAAPFLTALALRMGRA
ncbi:MAG: glycoside hydrolase family 9 protein [Fibrobacterota bacterium]